jgi:hypothetical protein
MDDQNLPAEEVILTTRDEDFVSATLLLAAILD